MQLYVVYNNVNGLSSDPFTAKNDYHAHRIFSTIILDGLKNVPQFKSSDFDLYYVGQFDVDTMVITSVTQPVKKTFIPTSAVAEFLEDIEDEFEEVDNG